jgi:hypothetical protein
MNSGVLGLARKSRGIYEGEEWAQSLASAKIPVEVWDNSFLWAIENISVQPLENTTQFLEHAYRLIQVYIPNRMLGWVYFRIEPDDENCTLLWIEARWFHRLG